MGWAGMGAVEGPEMERLGETLEPRYVGGRLLKTGIWEFLSHFPSPSHGMSRLGRQVVNQALQTRVIVNAQIIEPCSMWNKYCTLVLY